MELELWRYSSDKDATLGFLMVDRGAGWEFLCFICEDQFQKTKIAGETRIPAGRYAIRLRDEGGMTGCYRLAFPIGFHRGMLHLQNVPGFKWVYQRRA